MLGTIIKAQNVKLPNGIEYRYVKKGTGKQNPKVGDFVSMIIKSTCSGQVLFDSKSINKNGQNTPVNFPVQKSTYNGDVNGVLKYLHEGDSVVVRIPQDSFYRVPQAQRKNLIAGEPVIYTIGVYGVYTPAQIKKIQDDYKKSVEAFAKQQAEFKKQQQAQLLLQKQQAVEDKKQDAEMVKYFKTNGIANQMKLPSGSYIVMSEGGSGDLIKANNEVIINYEKFLLSGKKFESNIDTAFHNVNPLKVAVGQRQLLQGLDDALQNFKKGSKGQIFIPSKLGYGANKYPLSATDTIPANSVIKVDVEVLEIIDIVAEAIKLSAKEEEEIKAFIKTNNLTATKTNSGLYYVITQEGTGPIPVVGDEVNMNYTGMFLDGSKFDSNVDSSFGHVQSFIFPLGQGRVIRGWDEGIAFLKKGTKAKLILPSTIAYGKNGSGKIPANAILQFDVELLDIKKPVPAKK